MVGFPGETDEHFQETLNTIKEIAPKNCLVHIYSRRKGTPAYDFPNQVPLEVSQKRQQILHNEINNIKKFLFDKDHANKFFKHKPKNLSNCIIKYCDLYSDEDLNRLFQELPAYINEEKEIVLINNYNNEKDVLDLDINIKLLISVFGVKVITNLKINDDILDLIVNTPYKKFDSNFIDFCFNSRNFVNIDFDKLENSKEEDIIKWKNRNNLEFIACACKITEKIALEQEGTKRNEMKELIKEMKKIYENIDINIFRSVQNVNLDTIISYEKDGKVHHFLDKYNSKK
jgi:hypothetical protein